MSTIHRKYPNCHDYYTKSYYCQYHKQLVPQRAEAVSGKFIKLKCDNCDSNKAQIVQSQSYIGIGSIRFIGQGPRRFKAQCTSCDTLIPLTDQQEKQASRLKYRKPSSTDTENRLMEQSNRSYPVLTAERRDKIRKHNRKEGLMSLAIGVVIGLIITPFFPPWSYRIGTGFIILSILGGLYAIYEDPERKHRDLINAGKKLN